MKTPHFLMLSLLFVYLYPFSFASSLHENFLHCLSVHLNDSSSFSRVIYTPNNPSYSSVLNSTIRNLRFTTPNTPKPLVIITPLQTSHIQSTIYCSRKNELQIRTRSGGHDLEGLSYVSEVPFVIIDLINFRSVNVDVENKFAWVESGAILGELYYNIVGKSRNLAFPGGNCHTVGLGGYLSGGGYGLLFRKYGLAADNVIDAQIIDVNGRILDRKSMGEDLFWAIRGGGGGSFGIVLAWKLNLVPIPSTVTVSIISKTLEQNAIELIHRWQYVAPELPDEFFSSVSLSWVNSTQDGKKVLTASFTSFFLGGIYELVPLMQERFPELGLTKEDCIEMSWIESVLYFGQLQNKSLEILLERNLQSRFIMPSFKAKTDYVKKPIPEIVLRGLYSRILKDESKSSGVGFFAYGGKMARIPETATPFPHRAGNLYKVLYYVGWREEDNINSERYISYIRGLYTYMGSFVSKSPREAYLNYRDLDIGTNNIKGNTTYAQATIWGRKYFKNNFNRLMRVKTMIDPENFFKHEQSIPPFVSPTKK